MDAADRSASAPHGGVDHRSFRHWGGFIFSGLTAFLFDLAVVEVLARGLGVEPNLANLIGIVAATVPAWLLHRRISFNVPEPPSFKEYATFFLFASVANIGSLASNALFLWLFPIIQFDATVVAAFNWVFGALYLDGLLARPSVSNLEVAFFASRAVGGVLAYIGLRWGVFRRPRPSSA